ncbi:MAG: acyltransferase [Alphaproteobacteria bacterium]|nr:MAG: acyltransferase [Alphaproteobacteria bacterium]
MLAWNEHFLHMCDMSQARNSAFYLPHIDGLRALAVLFILLFHLDVPFVGGGFVGVDIFFVISGFLITQLIYRDIHAGTFSFEEFYARRVKRIFPALFTMLLVCSVVAVFFLGPREYDDFFRALRAASGQIANVFFSKEVDYFAVGHAHSPLLHTWSLGVEEQFYVIWPLLLLLAMKWGGRAWVFPVLALVGLISFGISVHLTHSDEMHAFYLLHSRAWELALGGLIGLNVLKPIVNRRLANTIGFAGLGLIFMAVLGLDSEGFPGVKAALPCVGAAMFIYAAKGCDGQTLVHRLMGVKPLVFVGMISYSLYLWHWPIIGFYKSYFGAGLEPLEQVLMACAALVLAYVSFRFVEQPLRHSPMSARKTLVTGLAVIAGFILVSNIVKRADNEPWRVTYKLDESILRPNSYYRQCAAEGAAYAHKDACTIGPNKEGYEVILTGDSHAGHYMPTVLKWAEENKLTVRMFLRVDCDAFLLPGKKIMRQGKVDESCMQLQKDFHEILKNETHIKYVFLSLRKATGTGEEKRAFEQIAAYGREVVYLGSVPEFKDHPHDCQMKNNLLASKVFPRKQQDCLTLDHAYSDSMIEAANSTLRPLLAQLGIFHFDPVPYVRTAYDAHGNFMYLDNNHLNTYGADYLEPYLDNFLKEKGLLAN